jgi:hypothetical protein
MINQQLLDYIKQQLQNGVSKEQIKSNLLSNGWQESDINEAFALVDSLMSSPVSQNSNSPQFPAEFQQPVESKTKRSLFTVLLALGILLVAGGVFGYFYYFRETPEKVIEKMKNRLSEIEIKTIEYQAEVKIATEPELKNPFFFTLKGKSDVSDQNNPKLSFIFETNDQLGVIKGEIRIINKIIYIKLNNLPNLGFLDLSSLSNQWIKIDTEAIAKQFGFEQRLEELQEQQKLTQEQIKKLKQIFNQTKVLRVTEKLASEKIEGIDTHHYKFSIDKNEFKKLIKDISSVQNKTLTDRELAEFDKSFDKALEAIELFGGEIWIGKKDYLPYRVILNLKIKETAEFQKGGQITITILLKNYNKPIQIDTPSPVKNIEEILGPLFSSVKQFQPKLQLEKVPSY